MSETVYYTEPTEVMDSRMLRPQARLHLDSHDGGMIVLEDRCGNPCCRREYKFSEAELYDVLQLLEKAAGEIRLPPTEHAVSVPHPSTERDD